MQRKPHDLPDFATDHLISRQRHVALLRLLLRLTLAGLVLLSGVQALRGDPIERFLALGVITLCTVASLAAMRSGQLRLAMLIFIWALWSGVTAQSWVAGGVRNAGLYVYPVVILISGWLLGRGHAMALTLASVSSLFGTALAMESGLLLPADVRPPLGHAAILAVLLVIGTLVMRYLLDSYWSGLHEIESLNTTLADQVQELSRRGEALERSQLEVRQTNAELEARVAERTAALSQALLELHAAKDERVQHEKLAALGAMVAGVSHELNTPLGNALTSASTVTHLMQDLAQRLTAGAVRRGELLRLAQAAQDNADLVERNIGRAAALIQGFKQVSVDEHRGVRERFELVDALDLCLALTTPTAERAAALGGTRLRIEREPAEPVWLDADPEALRRILVELTMNAAEHAFQGAAQGCITWRVERQPDAAVLTCTDDGAGLDEAAQRRAFEPFYTTRFGQSTGLGLAVSSNLASRVLGGQLSVQSAPGAGSRFVLRLPLPAP